MTVLEQFKSMLGENEELVEAFGKVEGAFSDAIKTRDKAKEDNRALKEFKAGLLGAFDLEDASVEDIVGLTKDARNTDIEKIEAKYKADLDALRSELATKESAYGELSTKLQDTVFENQIVNSGLLSDFVDEPLARKNITSMIKEQLIYEDGKVFVKDSATGGKATDLKTGEFLSANSVVESIKKTISPIYLNPQSKGEGMGTPPRNQGQQTGGQQRSKMTHAEKGAYIKEHGEQAYFSLPK